MERWTDNTYNAIYLNIINNKRHSIMLYFIKSKHNTNEYKKY